tara:strand:- start:1133 stop:2395 length:1263 start_codon:yes stop_codon:yes gene_type:complete
MTRAKGNLSVLMVALVALMVASAHSTSSSVVSQPVSVTYVMGAGDSRLDAVENARDMARRRAVSESGAYIQGTTELANGELSETIRVLKANYVRLTGEATVLRVTASAPNGELVYTAVAEIDESAMERRIEAMNQDRDLQRQVSALVSENEQLRARIDQLGRSTGTERLQLDRKRLVLESQLSDNQEVLKSMFKQGSLLDMKQTANADLQVLNQTLYRELVEPLTTGAVSAEIESITGGDGTTTARVRFSYESAPRKALASFKNAFSRNPGSRIMDTVSDHWVDYNYSTDSGELRRRIEDQTLANDYALEQQAFLSRYLVLVEVQLGNEKRYFPIAGVQRQRTFMTRQCDQKTYTEAQLKSSGWVQRDKGTGKDDFLCLHNKEESRRQLVEFTMTNEQAAEVRSIQARRVLLDVGTLKPI